jgi:hypothetical protein
MCKDKVCRKSSVVTLFFMMGLATAVFAATAQGTAPEAPWPFNIIIYYFWHFGALLLAPLAGFSGTQMLKPFLKRLRSIHKYCYECMVALVSVGITGTLAYWFWLETPGATHNSSLKIAFMVGCLYWVAVFVYTRIAQARWPDHANSLEGDNGHDLTILPGLRVKMRNEKKK